MLRNAGLESWSRLESLSVDQKRQGTMNFHHRFRRTGAIAILGVLTWSFRAESAQATRLRRQNLASAKERSSAASLRMINAAEGTYWGGDRAKWYVRRLNALGPEEAKLIDAVTASGRKDSNGSRLASEHTIPSKPIIRYTIIARTVKRLVSDQRSFFTDETGVIHFTTEIRAATCDDPPLDSSSHQ